MCPALSRRSLMEFCFAQTLFKLSTYCSDTVKPLCGANAPLGIALCHADTTNRVFQYAKRLINSALQAQVIPYGAKYQALHMHA
jgi:hypothetical protein